MLTWSSGFFFILRVQHLYWTFPQIFRNSYQNKIKQHFQVYWHAISGKRLLKRKWKQTHIFPMLTSPSSVSPLRISRCKFLGARSCALVLYSTRHIDDAAYLFSQFQLWAQRDFSMWQQKCISIHQYANSLMLIHFKA